MPSWDNLWLGTLVKIHQIDQTFKLYEGARNEGHQAFKKIGNWIQILRNHLAENLYDAQEELN
jgi:hypothetical protein